MKRARLHRQRTWSNLIDHKDTFLIQADKGGKPVLWYKVDYEKVANRQLADTTVYQELSAHQRDLHLRKIIAERTSALKFLSSQGFISSLEEERARVSATDLPPIYFLPKIHKPKREDTGTFAARPIIGATKTLKTLDLFITAVTTPLLDLVPHTLRDTSHLLRDLKGIEPSVSRDCRLFSADVVGLYPSIPWPEGIAAATAFYRENLLHLEQTNRRLDVRRPPDGDTFESLLKLVLQNNLFWTEEPGQEVVPANQWYGHGEQY